MDDDRFSVILHYQEAFKKLQDFYVQVVSSVHAMAPHDPNRESLSNAASEAAQYLRWHCNRCGAELESQNEAPVVGSVGRLNQLCMPCYHEMNSWPPPTNPEEAETP